VNRYVRYGGVEEEDGYQAMDSLLKNNVVPDAIFAVNDPVGIGAFQRIREASLHIPDSIAIMGFGNTRISELVDPPLSTVNQPSVEMGKASARILIDTINHKVTEPMTLVMETKLIVRKSS
jgi:LacI family transcriptional regulator